MVINLFLPGNQLLSGIFQIFNSIALHLAFVNCFAEIKPFLTFFMAVFTTLEPFERLTKSLVISVPC